ncbi:hypothetical protein [Rhodococcus rhodochrous]|uniref:Uncharacterized protein n=1 Tax=Rhodococcus rhodochrous TaxID=1829 RepID=A0AA46WRS5_RHORH|nr:hypothetical protein [Rhodococcus rhodochrous]UZF43196.1 hypothetical protein KUM34_014880 [Rhodococcus rhodochrous]
MTSIREKLAALRNLAREGAAVDAAELIALQAKVQAEDEIAELAAEGERIRAEEKAARARDARRAQAAAEARDIVGDTRSAVVEAHDKAAAALAALDAAVNAYNSAIDQAGTTLNAAGFAMWNQNTLAPKPLDHPDFDEALHVVLSHGGNRHVQLDNQLHRPIDAGYVALWAARNEPGVWDGLNTWKRDRNTYPLEAPLSELAE